MGNLFTFDPSELKEDWKQNGISGLIAIKTFFEHNSERGKVESKELADLSPEDKQELSDLCIEALGLKRK